MADMIQIRAGNKENMPDLADRELGYVRDQEALYIGTLNGNVHLFGADKDALQRIQTELQEVLKTNEEHQMEINALQEDLGKKLEASQVESQAKIAGDADLAAVISAVNAMVDAMKSSGVMRT